MWSQRNQETVGQIGFSFLFDSVSNVFFVCSLLAAGPSVRDDVDGDAVLHLRHHRDAALRKHRPRRPHTH